MNNILLVSEDFIKTNSALNDNLFGKYLLPAIREAQEINLVQTIGKCAYENLIAMVADGTIMDEENVVWKEFLDEHVRLFLVYQVQANLIPIINIKMANIGSVVSNDEHIQTLSQNNVDLVQNYFQTRADYYSKRCLEYMRAHNQEMGCGNGCDDTKTGTSFSPIWLG